MFGISVLFGHCRTISRNADPRACRGSVPSRDVTPCSTSTARPRAASWPPPPARAAALAAAGPGVGHGRHRPARLAPVRPARGHRPEPRPRCWRADRRLPARVDRRPAVRERGCTRRTTRASARADARAAVVPDHLGPERGGARRRAFDEHAPLVEELLERIRATGPLSSTDVEPRAAIDWYWRPTNQVRAILEALAEAGILGLARRDGNRRVYDLTERLFPADLLAERRPERDSAATSSCRGTARTGCSGARGVPSCGYTAPASDPPRTRDGPTRRADRRARRGRRARAGRGRGRSRRALRPREEFALPSRRSRRAGSVAGERGPGSRSSRRSIHWSGTATCCARCTTSTTSGRSTSRRPSVAGATTCCRCCSATGSSGGSSHGSTAGRGPARRRRLVGGWLRSMVEPGFAEVR